MINSPVICPSIVYNNYKCYLMLGLAVPEYRIRAFIESLEAGENECINSKLAPSSPYPHLSVYLGGRSKSLICSRVSYSLFKSPVPDSLDVLHTCDNKRCVNPKHLFLGDGADNYKDFRDKGFVNPSHLPVYLDLLDRILDLDKQGESPPKIGRALGITAKTIRKYLRKYKK